VIDFSEIEIESESTRRHQDGWCAAYSNVIIRNKFGEIIGNGNIDYIITDAQQALFWWEHLSVNFEDKWHDIAFYEFEFPEHIWMALGAEDKARLKSSDISPANISRNVFQEDLCLLRSDNPLH
jgi:hypothetical protein